MCVGAVETQSNLIAREMYERGNKVFSAKPRWIGITDKALASQFGGEGSSPAETRG